MKRVPQGAKGLRRRRWKGGVQGLLRVGAWFPLIADRDLARDLETLIESLQPQPRLIERHVRGRSEDAQRLVDDIALGTRLYLAHAAPPATCNASALPSAAESTPAASGSGSSKR